MNPLLFLWELPQNLLGLAAWGLFRVTKRSRRSYRDRGRVFIEVDDGAVSLGMFVFFATKDNRFVPVGSENVDHEFGHAVQSRWLGPLYLPVVGLPSALRAGYAVAYRALKGKRWGGYYNGFPENWADRLGQVNLAKRPLP